ncbi:Hcp family type VI secretion system effector [Roseateles amylovorans]|uniref:Type VI secretion system tube protein Hcp n=1 Tax=Roseateles amylovorans TaxID=2978473 RepID=A0ABY6B001_9BURK|nr:type VI secretion system tube protein Hcp [Roseateles amylovorans]UXH78517.1 type VI secretion system tube protein Hcp [Roseateles amylovorans]
MPGNSFINFGKNDVPIGESMQKGHHGQDGWIEISDWSFDIEADHSETRGGGAAVGKALPGSLSISHYVDSSSAALLSKMVAGRHFPLITIEMLKATGADAGPQTFFQVKVAEAFVTKVATKGGEDGTMSQDVEFVFKEVFVGYKPQNDAGKLDAALGFEWSVRENRIGSSISDKLR